MVVLFSEDIFGKFVSQSLSTDTDAQSTVTYASSARSKLDDTVPHAHYQVSYCLK